MLTFSVYCVLAERGLGVVPPKQHPVKRDREELRALWKKAINQQLLLIRMEKENARLRGECHIEIPFVFAIAIAQLISHQLLTLKLWVLSQSGSCDICSVQNHTETGFSLKTLFFQFQLPSNQCSIFLSAGGVARLRPRYQWAVSFHCRISLTNQCSLLK